MGASAPQQGASTYHSPTSSGAAAGFRFSQHRHFISQSSQPLACCQGTEPGWRKSSLLVPEFTVFQLSSSQELPPQQAGPGFFFWVLWGSGFCFCRLLGKICPSLSHHPCCCAVCRPPPVAPCPSSVAPQPACARTPFPTISFSERHRFPCSLRAGALPSPSTAQAELRCLLY